MSDKLEPCPFCAGRAEWRQGHYTGYVMCLSCEVMGPNIDKAEAIAAWNRRAARAEARPAPVVGREAVARVIGSYLVHDDKGGPDDETLHDVIGGDYEEATRRVYELTDRVLALLPLQEEARPRFSEGEVEDLAAHILAFSKGYPKDEIDYYRSRNAGIWRREIQSTRAILAAMGDDQKTPTDDGKGER